MAAHGKPKPPVVNLPLYAGQPHPCAYLPGHVASDEFLVVQTLPPALYQSLMDHGFRRSGRIVYRPVCKGCRACTPIRVPVAQFRASRSQRRVMRRNQDVVVETAQPCLTDEKWRLYQRYLEWQHDGAMKGSKEELEGFLYTSPTETREMVYRIGGEIMGVGIVDVSPLCLSSVYFYFDPRHACRSPGTFSAIFEIESCRIEQRPYWYAGFYIQECRQMNYKASFRPYELLASDGTWAAPPPAAATDDMTPQAD